MFDWGGAGGAEEFTVEDTGGHLPARIMSFQRFTSPQLKVHVNSAVLLNLLFGFLFFI